MFSNTEVIVPQIVMTPYIVASSSPLVISQRPIHRSLPIYQSLAIYQNSWLNFRSKSFSNMSVMRFLRLLKIMAPVLNTWFYPCHT